MRHQYVPTIGLFLLSGAGLAPTTFLALPILSSTELDCLSLPALTVTFRVVETFAFLDSLTLSVTVRLLRSMATLAQFNMLVESPPVRRSSTRTRASSSR